VRRLTAPLLVWIMAAGTMAYAGLAVAATALLADLGIGAGELGLVLLTYSATAALLSPVAGPITDRIGGTHAGRLALLAAAIGYTTMAQTTSTLTLALAVLPVAFAQSLINPATNAVIAAHTSPGRRGVITGVKQSGVYVGFVFVGLTAPPLTASGGWQLAFLVIAAACLLGLALSFVALPPTPGRERGEATGVPATARPDLRRLTIYAGLMGLAGSTNNFIPLFAETELGYSNTTAGLITSVVGVIAVASRILSARFAERSGHPGSLLRWMAGMGVVTNVVLAFAAAVPVLIWFGAGTYSLGLAPWNAVAMLAIIMIVGTSSAGTATGWVVSAFSAGLAIGPVVYGQLIDRIGFLPVWAVSGAAAALATAAVLRLRVEPV